MRMESDNLELVLKVKPIVDEATERYLGAPLDRLSDDITARLTQSSIFEFDIDINLPYVQAKRAFRKAFVTRLLLLSLGNLSEVARITGKNRRSVHRMVRQYGINVRKIKRDLIRPYDLKISVINSLIEKVLQNYQSELGKARLQDFYQHLPNISDEILREMPEPRITMKEALTEFDRIYFTKVLQMNGRNITRTAKEIGIRYETLSRKLRSLGLI
jgi:DNA-binding NtrC family response regulator